MVRQSPEGAYDIALSVPDIFIRQLRDVAAQQSKALPRAHTLSKRHPEFTPPSLQF
jgi:hypothetical protein